MKSPLSGALSAALLVSVGAAVAPSQAAEPLAAPLEVAMAAETPAVVVTATGTEVPVGESLAAVTVIDRDAIERSQATDLAEVLRFTSGLDLGRNGGAGQFTSVFIRGGDSNHTLVLIDGVRVNPATSGGAAVQNITPDMIERIEIVKGPRSTLYGSDAIGGVINVITRQADQPGADLRLRAGSDQTRDASVQLGYGDADKNLSLFAQTLDSDGYPVREDSPLDRGFRQTSLNGRGGVKFGPRVQLSARAFNTSGTAEYINFGSAASQDFQNQVLGLDLAVDFLSNWTSTLTLSRSKDDIQQNDANFLGDKDFVRTIRPGVEWRNVVSLGEAQRISLGLQAARDEVDAITFGSPIEENRSQKSVFLQDEIRLGRFRAVLGGNLADYEGFGNQSTWNVELGYDVLDGTRLLASAGEGFRAPDATDRFGFGGNPDLEPEQARNVELGLRQSFSPQQSADLRLFRSRVKDLIDLSCDPNFNCTAVNVDRYRNRGAELSWNLATRAWAVSVTGTVQDPENRDSGEQLLRRAKRSLGARVARTWGRNYVGIDALASASRPDFDRQLGGYTLVNLSAGAQLDAHFRLEGRIENLLDKDYQTASGYLQPDAKFYVTLRYGF